ncbi:MAG: hypothetical protein IJM30_08720 [Thermoguttaceae bacterium]|nr:hypothetical protein [Thermoguttaceae bacterium]
MAKSDNLRALTVQTTFTKQKRELEKASELIKMLRAQEKRVQRLTTTGEVESERRDAYLIATPQEISKKVLDIVESVVRQHGARQRANGLNKGRFEFMGVEAELTVPQLRALQDAVATIANLVDHLPVEDRRLVSNCEFDGRPAFAAPPTPVKEARTRIVPYEEADSTRIRTYQDVYEVVLYQTREITVDYGLPADKIADLKETVGDLATAVQVAIDEANAKTHPNDPELDAIVDKVVDVFRRRIAE